VGPRDGLQNIDTPLDVDTKVQFIHALSETGLRAIEVGAFVSPRAVPQMAASDEVFARLQRREGVRYPVLVPNAQGMEAALQAGVQEIAVFTAASETFNQKNINASIDESFERFRPVVHSARQAGVRVRGYVSTCFGCPYEGTVAPSAVHDVTRRLFDLGVAEVSIGDTIGVAVPTQVPEVMGPLIERHGVDALALHFHDTRGTAVANVIEALRMGIHIFDSSAGGLGGCPYAPGATGNVATEDLVYVLHAMGIETGIDLEKLMAASQLVAAALGTTLPSRVLRAENRS
jgi:isopropylmalate/homocitrate/citramalate synthase